LTSGRECAWNKKIRWNPLESSEIFTESHHEDDLRPREPAIEVVDDDRCDEGFTQASRQTNKGVSEETRTRDVELIVALLVANRKDPGVTAVLVEVVGALV
jgi:hypothetical protein